jgi:hypothetical protein
MPVRSISLTDEEQKLILGGILPLSVTKKVQTASKPKSTSYGRAKGMRGQHWVAGKIGELLNMEWEQADDNSPIAVRPSGQHGCDIILRGEAYNQFPFDCEVKWSESFDFTGTIRQAKENTNIKKGRYPLIIHNRKAFADPVVIMEWAVFEKLYKKE